MTLDVINLTVTRGERTFVTDLSFTLSPGAIHAIIGGNGTGKSTLLAALAGDYPAAGEIRIDGDLLNTLNDKEQAKRRAVLLQTQQPLPFSARDLVALAAPSASRNQVADLLRRFDLDALADRSMLTLSGGERGRAMLAKTYAQGTDLLLLDEPTAAFDRAYRHQFVEWLQEWRLEGKAIVVITHDSEIEAIADSTTSLD
jgi:iron complex transport system ATP-binding protein